MSSKEKQTGHLRVSKICVLVRVSVEKHSPVEILPKARIRRDRYEFLPVLVVFFSVHNYFDVHWAIQWLNAANQRLWVVEPTGVHVLYLDTC